MEASKAIALVAHDNEKESLLSWALQNKAKLEKHSLYATGTTGKLLKSKCGLKVKSLQSGPLGGDLQIGAMIAEGKINFLVFFWDPLEAQPHDPDVKALLRICAVWNIPVACNESSADFMFSSPLIDQAYDHKIKSFKGHLDRKV
ncbi:methylglyoxal synthase [Fulvivirgaceae bacterium BMA12]|uniref:Methylglyoxal synthase n=1 Tax=Agaribacillus aureus TaxID=3051825 RepID=A0ABT8L0T1_9BACT|nr:methylglyoxal synthase [Fulvivirgaceae bacterium BMA12]